MDRHSEAIEYDFLHLFGLDINELGCETFTYRRFAVLLGQMPQDSQFIKKVGGDIVMWDRKDHRLTDIFEAVLQLNHNLVQSHKKSRLPKLKAVSRPGFAEVTPGARTYKGKAIPLAELKTLTEMWRKGGADDGS